MTNLSFKDREININKFENIFFLKKKRGNLHHAIHISIVITAGVFSNILSFCVEF